MGGLFLVIAGVWVGCQVTIGDALNRTGILDAILGKNTHTGTWTYAPTTSPTVGPAPSTPPSSGGWA